MFITFEGLENSGKSTQAQLLKERFDAVGVPCVLTRDPGGAPSAEPIRNLLLSHEAEVGVNAELLCYIAARMELVEKVIQPALGDGKVVICDRFIDSTIAYQGYGNFYASEDILEFIIRSHNLFTNSLWPDITILLDIDLEESFNRFGRARDRIESRDERYFFRVKQGYHVLSSSEYRDRIRLVSAMGSIEKIAEMVWFYCNSLYRGDVV